MPAVRIFQVATFAVMTGCSSSSFELAGGAADAGDAGSETTQADSGTPVGDAGGPDALPPACSKDIPPMACAGGAYEPQFDLPGTYEAATPRIKHGVAHAISFVQTEPGRTEKIALRLRRSDAGSGVEGAFEIRAFWVPCEGTLVPLSTLSRPSAEIAGDTSFYFTGPFGSGAQYLPFLPKGSRLLFVIETTSTRYTWEHATAPRVSSDPRDFRLYTKVGTADWTAIDNRVAAAMSYLRAC